MRASRTGLEYKTFHQPSPPALHPPCNLHLARLVYCDKPLERSASISSTPPKTPLSAPQLDNLQHTLHSREAFPAPDEAIIDGHCLVIGLGTRLVSSG